jgi:hypothetical protein
VASTHKHFKSRRWFMTVFFRLMEICFLNTWCLRRINHPKEESKHTKIAIIEGLLELANQLDPPMHMGAGMGLEFEDELENDSDTEVEEEEVVNQLPKLKVRFCNV